MNMRARVTRAGGARAIAAVVLAVTATGCASSPPQPAPHEVRYRLTWDRDGVTPTNDGGFDVTNDLGYRVHVSRGWVTSYSMELVECPKEAAAGLAFVAGALVRPLLGDTAWAGHLSGTPNPAAIKPMQVESLIRPEPHEAGAVTLAPQPYCKLHYLVARAGHDSPGRPSELDMVDTTLHLDGTFRAPRSTTDTAFTVHTASAYGQLFDRAGDPPRTIRVDPGDGALQVDVRRHLGRMFDGVDFTRMPERAVALQILKALVDRVDVAIRPPDGNA